MGFFSRLVKNVVSDSIAKGIGDAVSKATEKAVAPAAEKLANEAADKINSAADTIEQSKNETESDLGKVAEELESVAKKFEVDSLYIAVLKDFPAWTFSAVQSINGNDEEEFTSAYISVDLNDSTIAEYQKVLAANGFTGDEQIMKKVINGKDHYVDFSFICEGEIQYLIYK